MQIAKPTRVTVAVLLAVILTSPIATSNIVLTTDVSTGDVLTIETEDLLQYEWPQIHGDPSFTRFSEGPAPESSDILWKTTVKDIESYLTAFNGKVFVTTATNVIAFDKDTGATIWNTTLPDHQQWPAVFKIDDIHLVIGQYCLNTESGEILWTSDEFSANVAYWAESVYSPDEQLFYVHGDSTVQAWNFSIPSEPPRMEWETYITGSSGSGAGIQYGDGKVFPGSFEPHQMCLDAKTGDVLWDTETRSAMTFSGSYYEGKFFKAGEHDNTFYCFDAESGNILWSFNPETHFGYWVSGCAAAYGKVYELNKDGNLYALDANSGDLSWKYEGPGTLFWPGWPVVGDGKIYATSGQRASSDPYTMEYSESEFVCLDAFTGALVWSIPIEAYAPRESVAIAYGNLYLIPGYIEEDKMNSYITPNEVWAMGSKSWPMWRSNPENTAVGMSGPTNVTLRWKFTTEGSVVSSPTIVDGKVYFGSQDKNVYCLDARNGRPIWNYSTEAKIKSSPAVVEGRVYIGPDEGYIYCINALNGSLLWKKYAGGYVNVHLDSVTRLASSPAVVNGNVYVGALDANVYCFDAYSGNITWTYTTEGPITSSPAVVGDAVYIVSQEPASAGLYRLDAHDGSSIWKLEIPYQLTSERGTDMHASPTAADGMIFVAANKDRYYGVNSSTGKIEWTYNVTKGTESGGGFLVASMAYNDGLLYVVDQFFITCLNSQDGTALWKSWMGAEVYVSPTYAEGKIYVATDRRSFYVINSTNGDRLSYFRTGSSCWSSPSLYEGKVYIGNQDWNIYCLDDSPVMSDQISLEFSKTELEVGGRIVGWGNISLGIAHMPVDVFFVKPDGSVDSLQVSTGNNGTFGFNYPADVVGNWYVSVWCSGASYILDSGNIPLTVAEQQSNHDSILGISLKYVVTLLLLLAIALIALAVSKLITRKDSSSPILING